MKARLFFGSVLLTFALVIGQDAPPSANAQALPPVASPLLSSPHQIAQSSAPLLFIQNVGQFDPAGRFQVCGADATIFIGDDGIWFTILERAASRTVPKGRLNAPRSSPRRGVNIKVSFTGANLHPALEPFNRLNTRVSYFVGADPSRWHADVPVWGSVRIRDLYPGIDLELSGVSNQIVPRLVMHAGANPNAVKLRVDGADQTLVEGDHLRFKTPVGDLSMPLLQLDAATPATLFNPSIKGAEVALPFTRSASPARSSAVVPSDLIYSTYLGGSGDETSGFTIAVDSAGAAYVTGRTTSANFPASSGVFSTTFQGTMFSGDAFVAKINPAGWRTPRSWAARVTTTARPSS